MRKLRIPYLLLALSFALPATAADAPADGLIPSPEPGWPQWRGPHRDGISPETGLLQEWPQDGPPLLWKFDGLGLGWSSPIIINDRIYITGDIGDDLVIFALDLNGNVIWQSKNGAAWKGSYEGARACCAYSESRLYNLNAHGRLACLDAATGAELWSADILQQFDAQNITWAIAECLLIDGPRVIVTPGGKKALVAALDKKTGQTLWTTPPIPDEQASYSSPILFAYAGRRIIANCTSKHGFAIDADTGQLLWTVPMSNPYQVNVATPIYGAGSICYITADAEDGRLYRITPEFSAQHVWTAPIDTVTGSGVLLNNILYAAGYRKAKNWFAIDWTTGKTLYTHNDLTTGAAIYADNRLYIQDERGAVALLNPTPTGLQTTGQFQLTPKHVGDAWSHPVIQNARLYLRYRNTLWCYNIKAQS